MKQNQKSSIELPVIGPDQIVLLERLSNAVALSGNEGEVRAIVLESIKGYADEVKIDALGNVLVTCKAKTADPVRVMVAAHMDEIGFMLVDEDSDGLFSFALVGGIDTRQLPGKMVWVGKQHLPGVIGARPIHLQEKDESTRTMSLSSLKIDLGPGGKGKAHPGEWATFATTFQHIGPSLVGKALDDRLGVATLIELVRNHPDNIELLAAFTVQEEVGLRGARVAGYTFNADMAFVIDSTPAFDLPTWDDTENGTYNTRLDAGPAIYIADSSTLSDPRLIRYLVQVAEENGIPYQFRQPGGGGTDAGAIHKVRAGIPSVSISVPGRYAHTACMIARTADWENTLKLVYAALNRISPQVLSVER